MESVNIPVKLEVRSFMCSWDNRGYSKKLSCLWIRLYAPFSPNFFHVVVLGWILWIYVPNMKSLALAVPEIIAIAVLGWVVNPQSRGRGGHRDRVSGMVPFEGAFVTSYRLSIVTFPLSLRVSDILPLLCCSTPLFPTPPLVSPNFPMFPWK